MKAKNHWKTTKDEYKTELAAWNINVTDQCFYFLFLCFNAKSKKVQSLQARG